MKKFDSWESDILKRVRLEQEIDDLYAQIARLDKFYDEDYVSVANQKTIDAIKAKIKVLEQQLSSITKP
jgi:polyhydroxyalkanoate synthesis regulator phasin